MIIDDIEAYCATKALIQSYDLQIEAMMHPYQSPQWKQIVIHSGSAKSVTERVLAQRDDLIKERDALIARNARAEEFVRTLEKSDSVTAAIIRLRFINGLKWHEVANKIYGRDTLKTVWSMYERFKRKYAENAENR